MTKKSLSPTIGIEVHIELKTDSKMFCGCPAQHFLIKPNTHTCPVCLGLPGALPVANKKALDWTIMIGLALKSSVNNQSKFDRKHYFYPDLPKGYQISQYDEPICSGGHLETSQGKVRITRVHLEEDTGKLVHKKIDGKDVTLVDFNRSGVPLVEVVTEPDITSPQQAKEFSQKLQQIVRFLNVSDADMEKGSMRLEANISLGLDLGYKVEVKNLNSFRFVERAISYELNRQGKILDTGKVPKQETRGFHEKENITIPQRYKETSADYRYFPEPDIPPLRFSKQYVNSLKKNIPELPSNIALRFQKKYQVRPQYAQVLTTTSELSSYAEKAFLQAITENLKPNAIASLIVNKKINIKKLSPLKLIDKVKKALSTQVTDAATINLWTKEAVNSLPKVVSDYKQGKTQALSVLIGKVMQISKSTAKASQVKKALEKKLK